jgi:hypothetical protein
VLNPGGVVNAVSLNTGEAMVDTEIVTLDPTELSKCLPEYGDAALQKRIVLCGEGDPADPPHAVGLRPRPQRQRRRPAGPPR